MPRLDRKNLTGYLFIAPQMLGYLLFVLGPLVAVVIYSFQERNLLRNTADFVGLENYRVLLTEDPLF